MLLTPGWKKLPAVFIINPHPSLFPRTYKIYKHLRQRRALDQVFADLRMPEDRVTGREIENRKEAFS